MTHALGTRIGAVAGQSNWSENRELCQSRRNPPWRCRHPWCFPFLNAVPIRVASLGLRCGFKSQWNESGFRFRSPVSRHRKRTRCNSKRNEPHTTTMPDWSS